MTSLNFKGFPGEAFVFLNELESNNNKEWFNENKQRYVNFLVEPLRALVCDLGDFMLSVDTALDTTPAIGKTISRIYKDARRLRGAPPYRTSMWISFKRPLEDWKDAPVYFFEIEQNSYTYGMGFYSIKRDTMDKFREFIDRSSKRFLETISFYGKKNNSFKLFGASYKKLAIPQYPAKIIEWYQKKNFHLACSKKIDQVITSSMLIDELIGSFSQLAPLYHYMREVKDELNAEKPPLFYS